MSRPQVSPGDLDNGPNLGTHQQRRDEIIAGTWHRLMPKKSFPKSAPQVFLHDCQAYWRRSSATQFMLSLLLKDPDYAVPRHSCRPKPSDIFTVLGTSG